MLLVLLFCICISSKVCFLMLTALLLFNVETIFYFFFRYSPIWRHLMLVTILISPYQTCRCCSIHTVSSFCQFFCLNGYAMSHSSGICCRNLCYIASNRVLKSNTCYRLPHVFIWSRLSLLFFVFGEWMRWLVHILGLVMMVVF